MKLTDLLNAISPRTVLNDLPDALLILEEDGRICQVNKKAVILFGVEKSILKNCSFDDFVNEGMKVIIKSANKRLPVITAAASAEGKEFYVEINAKFYDDRYLVTIRDVTAMTGIFNDAEETARLTRDKNLMLTKLSTEIKSPLQSMLGFSQALLDGLGGDINGKQEKYIKIINKNTIEMLYFMNKLVEFSQSESNYYKPDIEPFDVINTTQSVLRANDTALAAKNLTVNLDHEDFSRKTVYSDENFFRIILQNVIDASIKLTEVGSITVKMSYPDNDTVKNFGIIPANEDMKYMQITVNDTGMGLTESEVEELFNPYMFLDKNNKKNIGRAFSLGGALNFAKKLGGTVHVRTEVMKGCEFNIILPADKDTDE